jgi:hypothetical protein
MSWWLTWLVVAAVAVALGLIGYQSNPRTLRWAAFAVAVGAVAYLTVYGFVYAEPRTGSLSDAFARGADTLSSALIRPLSGGREVPAPGRIGWLVIVVLLALGYRALEAWTMRHQAPSLDVSDLRKGKLKTKNASPEAKAGEQRHDLLVAELRFRLPSVEVRLPAILPGGSRPASGGLASIAEDTGVTGAGLAGAIIRLFGMVWPNPPRLQVRAWVERSEASDAVTRVTVSLADPRSGASVATKTLAAADLDDAVDEVAGYVARHIFARDRTVPPWSASADDGADLAALLRARRVRGYPECPPAIRAAWHTQIEILESVARRNLCAGVVRYELAQLYDLTGRHTEALLLHAANREQYPTFYRGRYRLAMSLEMIANPDGELKDINLSALLEALRILDRCRVTSGAAARLAGDLSKELRLELLTAARRELLAIREYLTLRHIVWRSVWHRDERAILRPYWKLRHRQAFQDGVHVALLLVAVRQARIGGTVDRLPRAAAIATITAAISGDSRDFATAPWHLPARTARRASITARLRTRRWPWRCSTPSWPAAYNLACAYAALPSSPGNGPAVTRVLSSLQFAVCNPECEMERPSEWISHDPDLNRITDAEFAAFVADQRARDYLSEGEPPHE